jgi:hypothetical protein
MNNLGQSEATGRVLNTVLGPLKVVPECKAQAVCVNGSRCWEAGRCLKAEPTSRGRSEC